MALLPEPPDGDQEYVKAPVPPAANTLSAPFVPPKQDTFAGGIVAVMAVGSVTKATDVVLHPCASVMVQVYCPVCSPAAFAPFPPDGNQEYVYALVPPDAATESEPVLPPWHRAGFVELVAVSTTGWVMITTEENVQAFESVTRQV